MNQRSETLQRFVEAAETAFTRHARGTESTTAVRAIFKSLASPGAAVPDKGTRLEVCGQLDGLLDTRTGKGELDELLARFRQIEPTLQWRRRTNNHSSASENFDAGHANAMVLGPAGLEHRTDVWLGVSLLAPNVRYPDHNHEPEEVYLVMSDGEFRQDDGDWFAPGIGGSFYNRPNIKHAMRSRDTPLLAFWALRPGRHS